MKISQTLLRILQIPLNSSNDVGVWLKIISIHGKISSGGVRELFLLELVSEAW